MSILANAKNKAAHGNVKEAFKNEVGAIDLASIMVGILVIGLIGGVIAATVFAVIPWSQDNAAKQQLDAVNTAQSARAGLNDGKYSTNLASFLDTSNTKVTLRSNEGDCFGAFVTSASGAVFYSSSVKTQPTKIAANAAWPSTKPTGYPVGCSWPGTQESASVPPVVSYSPNSSLETNDLSMMSSVGGGNKKIERLLSTSAHSGNYVFRVTATADTSGFGYGAWSTPLEPGDYVASVRVRSSNPMVIRPWTEFTGGAVTSNITSANANTTPDGWSTLWANVTVVDNGTTLKPGFLKGITNATAGEWVEMDSFQVVKATGNNVLDATYAG